MVGPRGPLRDNLTGVAQRRRPRRTFRLGRTRLHHREGQGYQAVTQGQAGLRWCMVRGGI